MPSLAPPKAALVNLDLQAVALCNEGSNSRAHILLTKRKEKSTMPKTFEELIAALTDEQAEIINKHIATLVDSQKDVVKGLNDKISALTAEVETLKKNQTPPPQQEDVLKSASPELRAMIEQLQSTVKSLTDEREADILKARYEKVKALPVEEDLLKSVLRAASPATYSILEAAAAAIEKSLAPKGTDGGEVFEISADANYTKLEKSAKNIMKDQPEISFEKAFMLACERDPETYLNYTKGMK